MNLLTRINEWSVRNFGSQKAKGGPLSGTDMHHLAPLMGLAEEIGELAASSSIEHLMDAMADIGIYLLDYCGRRNITLQELNLDPCFEEINPDTDAEILNASNPNIPEANRKFTWFNLLTVCIGTLFHCNLKQAQGIRGFDCPNKFQLYEINSVRGIWMCLEMISELHEKNYSVDILGPTAEKVLRRDWTKHVLKGVESCDTSSQS